MIGKTGIEEEIINAVKNGKNIVKTNDGFVRITQVIPTMKNGQICGLTYIYDSVEDNEVIRNIVSVWTDFEHYFFGYEGNILKHLMTKEEYAGKAMTEIENKIEALRKHANFLRNNL